MPEENPLRIATPTAIPGKMNGSVIVRSRIQRPCTAFRTAT